MDLFWQVESSCGLIVYGGTQELCHDSCRRHIRAYGTRRYRTAHLPSRSSGELWCTGRRGGGGICSRSQLFLLGNVSQVRVWTGDPQPGVAARPDGPRDPVLFTSGWTDGVEPGARASQVASGPCGCPAAGAVEQARSRTNPGRLAHAQRARPGPVSCGVIASPAADPAVGYRKGIRRRSFPLQRHPHWRRDGHFSLLAQRESTGHGGVYRYQLEAVTRSQKSAEERKGAASQ